MNKSVETTVDNFNKISRHLALSMADSCPYAKFGINKKIIKRIFETDSYRYKFIDMFTAKVLQYKDEIESGNEDFFLRKEYDEDLNDVEHGSWIVSNMFQFKDIWTNLTDKDKNFVIEHMKLLCTLSQEYFVLVHGLH